MVIVGGPGPPFWVESFPQNILLLGEFGQLAIEREPRPRAEHLLMEISGCWVSQVIDGPQQGSIILID